MTATVVLGLGLALAASVALNAAYLLQHAGAAGAPAISPLHLLRTMHGLFGSRDSLCDAAIGVCDPSSQQPFT